MQRHDVEARNVTGSDAELCCQHGKASSAEGCRWRIVRRPVSCSLRYSAEASALQNRRADHNTAWQQSLAAIDGPSAGGGPLPKGTSRDRLLRSRVNKNQGSTGIGTIQGVAIRDTSRQRHGEYRDTDIPHPPNYPTVPANRCTLRTSQCRRPPAHGPSGPRSPRFKRVNRRSFASRLLARLDRC